MNPRFHINQVVRQSITSGAKQFYTQESLPPAFLEQQIAALLHCGTLHGITRRSVQDTFRLNRPF